MAFDTRKWLKEDLGFSDAELTPEFVASFESRADKIEKGQLRLSDYSRFSDEYKKKSNDLTQEIADWTQARTTTDAEAETRRLALEALEQEKLVLTQAVNRLAEQAGVDPADVLKGRVTPPKKEDPPPAPFDPSPILQQVGGVAKYMLDLATELPMIAAEHLQLTGQTLDTRAFRKEIEARAARKESTDPVQVWETLYGIPDKRTAKAIADRTAEITAAEQRGREAAKSEAAIPGASAPGSHAPIFQGTRKSALERPQPGRNTAGFAQSLAKGTYRPATGGGRH